MIETAVLQLAGFFQEISALAICRDVSQKKKKKSKSHALLISKLSVFTLNHVTTRMTSNLSGDSSLYSSQVYYHIYDLSTQYKNQDRYQVTKLLEAFGTGQGPRMAWQVRAHDGPIYRSSGSDSPKHFATPLSRGPACPASGLQGPSHPQPRISAERPRLEAPRTQRGHAAVPMPPPPGARLAAPHRALGGFCLPASLPPIPDGVTGSLRQEGGGDRTDPAAERG